jgi:hypothetical protein
MLKYSQKHLTILLTIVSVVSLLNALTMYWLPVLIPLSSFSAVRLTVLALFTKQYYLIPVSLLLCVLLFLTTISICKKHCFLPVVSLLYLIYDSIIVLLLFADGLDDGYWGTYIIQVIVSISLTVLLSKYCWNCLRDSRRNTNDKHQQQSRSQHS